MDLECLAHSNDFLKIIVVSLIGIKAKDYSSSDVLKDCVLLLHFTFKKLQDVGDGVTHGIGLWTRNVERPKLTCDVRERWYNE